MKNGNVIEAKNYCEKALKWLVNSIIPNKGIIVTNKQRISYPEVSGYCIPTLYMWGEKERAKEIVKWLIRIQNKDGSFSATDGVPYTFDTGQVIRGFLTVLDDMPEIESAVRKACDYIASQIDGKGKVNTPSTFMWGNETDDRIHLYIAYPLMKAGEKLKEKKYINAAKKILNHYKKRTDLLEFNIMSHFYAYVLEALYELDEKVLAKKGMGKISKLQKEDGSIPAYPSQPWTCSVAVAQFAKIWYSIGEYEKAEKAMAYLERIQEKSGGFYGGYGNTNYFSDEEISWAVKFFLDAYNLKIKNSFDNQVDKVDVFPDSIKKDDFRIKEILSFVNDMNNKRIIDLGCGKGRFLKFLKKIYPKGEYYGLDISKKMLKYCPDFIHKINDTFLDIKYPSNYFDYIICIESLEHAVNINGAIKEISRVLKPGGKVLIIDKNQEEQLNWANRFGKIPDWEKWFNPKEVMGLLKKYGINASYKIIDGLFIICDGLKIEKVSIVLPTHNGSKYIKQAIDAILNQTYKNIELIIVNDGSTDNTDSIIKSYKDKRIKILANNKRKGLPFSLNLGFANAIGGYLTWNSDDNIYLPNAIERMLDFLKENKGEFVYSDYYNFNEDDLSGKERVNIDTDSDLVDLNYIGCCFLYTKKLKDEIGEYDLSAELVEDYDYWIRVSKKFKMLHLAEPLCCYRRHSMSLTSLKSKKASDASKLMRLKHKLVKNHPKISIIIPTYNNASILKKTLKRIKKQNFRDYEIIVSDDGSTDNTEKICRSFNVRYAYQSHKGAGSARNSGIKICRGDIILFLGDDQLIDKNFLEKRFKKHLEYDGAIISPIYPYNKKSYLSSLPFYVINDRGEGLIEPSLFYTSNISLQKKWLVKDLFDEKLRITFEDVELGYRLYKKGLKLYLDKDNITLHNHPMNFKQFKKLLKIREVCGGNLKKELKNFLNIPTFEKVDYDNRYQYYLHRVSGLCWLLKKTGFELNVLSVCLFLNKDIEKYLSFIDSLKDKKKMQLIICYFNDDVQTIKKILKWIRKHEEDYKILTFLREDDKRDIKEYCLSDKYILLGELVWERLSKKVEEKTIIPGFIIEEPSELNNSIEKLKLSLRNRTEEINQIKSTRGWKFLTLIHNVKRGLGIV